jgi:hypothetical protein
VKLALRVAAGAVWPAVRPFARVKKSTSAAVSKGNIWARADLPARTS